MLHEECVLIDLFGLLCGASIVSGSGGRGLYNGMATGVSGTVKCVRRKQ